MDAVVKVDAQLLKKINDWISKKENNFRYVNKKQFIDIAVSSLLEKETLERKEKEKKRKNGR